jgi:bifunctional DNA-binding transcriptional regulator/antitoxin component of YhaV-PrlF toxin-antitoxin module
MSFQRRLVIGGAMAQVIIDADWHVEIPQEVRREANIQAGQKLSVVTKGGVISLVPASPAAALRGLVKGEPTEGYRDKKDRV